jgi:hypothetical protein
VKLLGRLPNPEKDDGATRNGLATSVMQSRVVEPPTTRVLAVVELHTARITSHVDEGGWREPAMVVHRIEPCLTAEDEFAALTILNDLAERRTGRQPSLFGDDLVPDDASSLTGPSEDLPEDLRDAGRAGLRLASPFAVPDDEDDDAEDDDDPDDESGPDLIGDVR